MLHDDGALLEPNHGRYDSKLIRRQYEGSSVEIGPDRISWTPPTYRWSNRGGFTASVGDQPGQAHAVIRIRTELPSRYATSVVARYAVTDAAGAILGSFPSGEGISGSSLPEHLAGWYPVTAAQKAVEQAGLVWEDRDFDGDASALEAAFPGVVPHLRVLHRLAWLQSVAYFVGGLVFLCMAIGWLVGGGSGRSVIPLAIAGAGVVSVFAGIPSSPPMMRHLHNRHLARQRG